MHYFKAQTVRIDEEMLILYYMFAYSVSEEESELITCFCMKPYAGRPMIECSECETWIHFSCAKIRKNNVPEVYTCQLCRDSKFTARKSNRVRTENNKFTT